MPPITARMPEHGVRKASVLLYGVPKTGKTENALQFPFPLVLATGANTGTLEQADFPYLVPDDWDGTWGGFRSKVLPVLKARQASTLVPPGVAVETIVIDELNNLIELLVNHISGPDPARKWTMQDFGRFGAELSPVLRDLANLKNPLGDKDRYNVVATCHVRDVTDGDGNLAAIAPKILGQTKDMVGAYFDFVALLTKELATEIDATTKTVRKVAQYHAYTSPPDKFHARLGLGGSIGRNFPARLHLTGPTTLHDEIVKHLGG